MGIRIEFVLDNAVWSEMMMGNRNQLAKTDHRDILEKLSREQRIVPSYQPFGNGHAAEEICRIIREWERNRK